MKNIQFSKQELEFIKQYTIQEMSAFSNGVRNFADEAPAPKTEGEAAIANAKAASSNAGSIGDSTFGSVANGVKNAGASWADNASKNSFNSASRGLTDTIGNLFKDPGKTWDSLGSGEKFGLVGGAAALGAIPLATFLMSKKKNKWRNTLLSMLPAAAIGAGIAGLGMKSGDSGASSGKVDTSLATGDTVTKSPFGESISETKVVDPYAVSAPKSGVVVSPISKSLVNKPAVGSGSVQVPTSGVTVSKLGTNFLGK